MGAFLREIFTGISSGRAAPASIGMFDLTFILFLIATVAYLLFMASRKDGFWRVGIVASAIAAIAMTIALALRWIAAGWEHPPFTNLYESLVFFAWGIVIFYLFVEYKFRIKIAGAFIIPLACITMGMASLSPNKEIEPLLPALQSVWLHMHVMVASIGYAAFLAAYAFALLYFIKDRVRLEWFALIVSAFAVFAVLAATKGSILSGGNFYTDKMVQHGAEWVKVQLPTTEDGLPVWEQIKVPGVGLFLLFATLAYFGATISAAYAARKRKDNLTQSSLYLLGLAFVGITAGLFWLVVQFRAMPEARLSGSPYSFAMLIVVWLNTLIVLIAYWRYDMLIEALPPAKTLDRLTYNTIMVGFPLMTLVIVTGAIWANKAWGRYWGWDPKETASLVTWLIYLLYLHTRLTQGWTGRRSMIIAVIGFVSVVFTYLGVNLLLSGLHAYATG